MELLSQGITAEVHCRLKLFRSCTSWLVYDTVELEKAWRPTVRERSIERFPTRSSWTRVGRGFR